MARHCDARVSGTRPPWLVLIAAWPFVVAGPGAAIDGAYLGSYTETDLGAGVEPLRTLEHRTDLQGRHLLAPGVDGTLRANLRYSTRPGEEDTELLRSRLYGNADGSGWRAHGQWVPWQDRAPGPDAPRHQELSLGGQWRRAPGGTALSVDWSRVESEAATGRSRTEDRRAEIGRAWEGFHASTSWRRIDADPPAATLANAAKTEEWRAAAGFDRSWRTVTCTINSDAVVSDFRSGGRRRDFHAEYVQATTTWRAVPRVVVSALGQIRKGESDDNALPSPQPLEDEALSLGAEYRPVEGLLLDGSREHRRREDGSAGDVVTDYVRLGASFRRELVRSSTFHTGYEHSVDLAGDDAEVPRNNLWATVESKLRPGLTGRADVRTQSSPLEDVEGRTWRYGTQMAMQPTAATRLDVEWAREIQPEFEGVAQREHEWSFTGGWSPGRSSLVSSLRLRDGSGRIDRSERMWTVTSSWQVSRDAKASIDATRRNTEVARIVGEERTWGVGLTTSLPRGARLLSSLRRVERTGLPRALTGTVTVDFDFNLGGAS